MSGAGRHPCCFCHAIKTSWTGDLSDRTFANITQHYFELMLLDNGDWDKAKDHMNCVGQPSIGDGSDTPVLWWIVPAFLHLILSLNDLLKALWKLWPQLQDWLKRHNLQFVPYHRGDKLGKPMTRFALYGHPKFKFLVRNLYLTLEQLGLRLGQI